MVTPSISSSLLAILPFSVLFQFKYKNKYLWYLEIVRFCLATFLWKTVVTVGLGSMVGGVRPYFCSPL